MHKKSIVARLHCVSLYAAILLTLCAGSASAQSAYWTFDDGGGPTAADASGNGNTATLVNGPAWTAGKFGGALSFDGVDDGVTVAKSLLSGDVTVSAWVNQSATAGNANQAALITEASNFSSRIFTLLLDRGNKRICLQTTNTSPCTAIGSYATAGTWTHVVLTHPVAGRGVKIYLDGKDMTPDGLTTETITGGNIVGIGRFPTVVSRTFGGLIDDFRIFNRILTTQEIQDLFTGDLTAPAISGVTPSAITTTTATIAWTTNEPANSQVEYGLTTSYGSATVLDGTLLVNHSQALSGLGANTVYHYRVKSRDAAGNLVASPDFTFATAQTAIAGLIAHWKLDDGSGTTAVDASASGNTALLVMGPTWTAGRAGGAVLLDGIDDYLRVSPIAKGSWRGDYTVALWAKAGKIAQPQFAGLFANLQNFGVGGTLDSFQIDVDGGNPGNYRVNTIGTNFYNIAPVTTVWQFLAVSLAGTTLRTYSNGVLTNTYTLSPGESNFFRDYLIGINRGGSRVFQGAIDEVRVYNQALTPAQILSIYSEVGLQDVLPPVISNVRAAPIAIAASVTWTTDEPSDSRVEYGLTASYGSTTAGSGVLTTDHAQTVPGLTPGTIYHYRVVSRDVAGNTGFSPDAVFQTAAAAGTAQTSPNIILILADDLGWQGVGAYGQPLIQTPNIDNLAREGMLFTDAYAGAAVCCPARSSLVTGQHTGHTRLRLNDYVDPQTGTITTEQPGPLLLRDPSIAETLRWGGYKTALIGKWHTGAAESSGHPNFQGFDYFFGHLIQTDGLIGYFPASQRENNAVVSIPAGTYIEDFYTQKAIAFITENRNGPFFLHLTYNVPHRPYQAPSQDPYVKRPWSFDQKTFAAMITRMDTNIGAIMTALANLGIDQNTLVIFTSDNGPEMCCDDSIEVELLFKTGGPLRGYKHSLYEGGIRVPLIARWPGRIAAGAVHHDAVAAWDLLPTFAEIANVPPPRGIDGMSLTANLLTGAPINREYLYWETPKAGGSQALRMGNWKGVRTFGSAPRFELFNLALDVGEKTDVASGNPAIAQKMQAIMTTGRTVAVQDGFPMPVDNAIVCREHEYLNGVDLLSYSGSSPACAHLAAAASGERAYTDQTATISSLPAAYQGKVLLRHANQDKNFQWSTFARLAVRQPSTVAVAYDAGATVLPSWLSGWNKTGEVVRVSGLAAADTTFNIYSRTFGQNATIFLGGNAQDGGTGANSYLVLVNTNSVTQVTGLVARWSFDEASGNIALDSSGYEYDGLLYNGGAIGGGPVRVPGKFGGALSFDGVNDFVLAGTGETRRGDYTVTLWAKAGRTAQPIFASLFGNLKSFGTGGSIDSFQIEVDGGNPGTYRVLTTRPYPIAPVTTAWQFIAVTLSGTTLRTYNNGSLTGTYTLAAGESNYFRDYVIGVNRAGNRFFQGVIDDVRVYNRTLSVAEIAAIFNGTQ